MAPKLVVAATLAAAITVAAGPARADRVADVPDRPAPAAPVDEPFWDRVVAPHAADLQMVLAKVAELRGRYLDSFPLVDHTQLYSASNAEARRLALDDMAGMLRWALALAPHDLDLRREMALVLHDRGDAGAEAALIAYLSDELPDRPVGEARTRLAALYARSGRFDAAAAELRLALGGGFRGPRHAAILTLAEVYMADGRLTEAIDLLESATAGQPIVSYGPDIITYFALVVAYDRDEQLSRAHDLLARLATLTGAPDAVAFALADQSGNRMPFCPIGERLYWSALQLEVLGFLPEARTEWVQYTLAPDARYAARARAHVRAIDELLAERAAEARNPRRARGPATLPPMVPLAPVP